MCVEIKMLLGVVGVGTASPKDPRIYFSWLPATFQGSGPLEANAGR